MKLRIALFVAIIAISESLFGLIGQTVDPLARTQLTLDAVNGSTTVQRAYEHTRGYARPVAFFSYAMIGVILFWPRPVRPNHKQPVS